MVIEVYARHLIYIIRILILLVMFAHHFPRKKSFRYRLPVVLALFVTAGVLIPDHAWLEIIPTNTLSLLLFQILGIKILFNVSEKQAVFCVASVSLLEHFGSHICTIAIHLLIHRELGETWSTVAIMQGADVAAVWLLALTGSYITGYVCFVRQNQNVENVEIKDWKMMIEIVTILIIVYITGDWFFSKSGKSIIVSFLMAVCSYSLLEALYASNRIGQLEIRTHVMKQFLQGEQHHYENLTANIDVINRKCHDLKYQIAALEGTAENQQKERQLQQLRHDVAIYENLIHTGNLALDNTLSEKTLICESKKIRLECRMNGLELGFMEALDIYILFGNALDNAIESVQKLPDERKRFISVITVEKENILKIHMENFCGENVLFAGGVPKTSKSDKMNHGYGVESMRYIVEKYGGNLTFSQQGELFYTDILFLKEPESL